MCSIFGIIGSYDEKQATKALQSLSHRGKDFCGIVQQEELFFTHQRLSIKDTNKNSNQPLKHKDILLSFNGEIYNFKELKKELDFEFKTQGDAEVIIAAYLKWGVDFVNHLRGMFAIALLDAGVLYLFRDRLGKKPLFFMQKHSSFIFASEIKALRGFLDKVELNQDALMSYLSFLAPTPPHTFFKNIYKLGAGEYLVFKNYKYEVKRYFEILDAQPELITNKDEAIYTLEKILDASISMRLDADVKVASLLSGGIDSATINAYALKHSKQMQTYTLGYKEYAKYDERKAAKESADFLGLANKSIEISKDDFIDASDEVLQMLDEPLNDPASIPLYLLFKEIKKDGYKVVMSGEGSDELFLGYRQYFEYLDIQQLSKLKNKNWLKRYFHSNFSKNREWEHYKRVFDNTLLFRTSGECFSDLQKNLLLKQNIKDDASLKYLKPYRDRFDASKHKDESLWYSYIDLHLFQAEHFLTKLDRMSMAHTIESRTPFLDHELVSTIFSISAKLRYEDGVTKSLLKEILKPHLSEKILSRKKKGFSNPYMEYLVDAQKLQIIKDVNKQTAIFKPKELDAYIEGASSGKFKQHLWGLYVLSVWLKRFTI
jgi:asparagine synthase (glutamine-hydrolysing)